MSVQINMHVKVAWWVRWYLGGVEMAARVTGMEPDWGKVRSTIERGIHVVARPRLSPSRFRSAR